MFETNQAIAKRQGSFTIAQYEPLDGIRALSMLFWGEHCIECAAPSCFETCDLYQARPDGRCRRFVHGQVRNSKFISARGYGVEVTFKKWGKLQTRGTTSMVPIGTLLRLERAISAGIKILDGVGPLIARATRDERWRDVVVRLVDRVLTKLHTRSSKSVTSPDAFVLEVFNPAAETVRLQLGVHIGRLALRENGDRLVALPSLIRSFDMLPGYSRHVVPYTELAPITESGLPFNMALLPEGDTSPTLVFLLADFVAFDRVSERASRSRPPVQAKCVVWDLDNTLWQGTLLESDDVRLTDGVVELLRSLDERGILLSVASKNDYDLAIAKMMELGIEQYMLYPQIGWGQKSEFLKVIAEKLNISLDSFVFVDDNSFELAEVAGAVPGVTCIDAREMATLAAHPRLQGGTSEEARRRRLLYREAMVRDEHAREFGSDYFSFLRSCGMHLRILPYSPDYYERLCELVQRTNQLNFSGRKYKREEIQPLLDDKATDKWLLECWDNFGSYGIVGCGVISRGLGAVKIEDFMLSCRVQGKFVEQAFFEAVLRDQNERLYVNFRDTGRNVPARKVLQALGFVEDEAGMLLEQALDRLRCDFIEVEFQVSGAATNDLVPGAVAAIPA